MNNINDELLKQGMSYTVGTNDGKVFDRVVYKGTRNVLGKQIMCFETQHRESVNVNPSYFSYSIEDNGEYPQPEDFGLTNKGQQ